MSTLVKRLAEERAVSATDTEEDFAEVVQEAMGAYAESPRNNAPFGAAMLEPMVEPLGNGAYLVTDRRDSDEEHRVAWWVLDDFLDHLEDPETTGAAGVFGVWLSKRRRQRGQDWGAP